MKVTEFWYKIEQTLYPRIRNSTTHLTLALPFMSLWYFLPESPRWLLSKGRNKEAIEVLRLACKWNKKNVSKIDNLKFIHQEENVKMGTFKDLFRFPSIRRNAFCMTICWMAFSMGYFGLVYNTPTFDWNIYLVFVLPVFFTLPICFVQPWIENKLGRKPLMTFPLLVAGVVLLLTTVLSTLLNIFSVHLQAYSTLWPESMLRGEWGVYCMGSTCNGLAIIATR